MMQQRPHYQRRYRIAALKNNTMIRKESIVDRNKVKLYLVVRGNHHNQINQTNAAGN